MKTYKQAEATRLHHHLTHSSLAAFSNELMALYEQEWEKILRHGDLSRWQAGFDALPDVTPSIMDFNASAVKVGRAEDTDMSGQAIEAALKQMHPWRKGPFDIFGVHIDTEWRSDWKWNRLKDAIIPLQGRTVLDVGSGSGYHLWRMLGANAKFVLGIDPAPLFSMHFATVKRYQPDAPVFMLPAGIEHMPANMACFDTVFSMGILYHRKSPIDHLIELKGLLNDGGELVLETLIVDGNETTCLVPEKRYAKMRNVWFIPSVKMLQLWLARAGFANIRCVDISATTTDEQRKTDWMRFESLSDFLDPGDSSHTIEGYPAPRRSIFTASNSQ